jgi:LmbE family N-acetylglucosaminyl deacetylase
VKALLIFIKLFNHLYCLVRGILLRRFYLSGLPETGLPVAERILIVAPHMDDEAIGCAGMIARAVQNGIEVAIVFLTDGAHGLTEEIWQEINAKRIAESRAAAQILGVKKLHFMQQPDGQVDLYNHLQDCQYYLRWHRPCRAEVFAPYDPQALHCDSRSVTTYRQLFRRALQVPENDLSSAIFSWYYNHSAARLNRRLGLRAHGPLYCSVIYRMPGGLTV